MGNADSPNGQNDRIIGDVTERNQLLKRELSKYLSFIIAILFSVSTTAVNVLSLSGKIEINSLFSFLTGISLSSFLIYVLIKNQDILKVSLFIVFSFLPGNIFYSGSGQTNLIPFILIPFLSIRVFGKKAGSLINLILLFAIVILSLIFPEEIYKVEILRNYIVPYNIIFFIALFYDKMIFDKKNESAVNSGYDNNLFDTLVNCIPDMIYFKDINGKYKKINDSLARRLDLENVELAIDKSESDFIDPEIAEIIFGDDLAAMASDEIIVDQISSIHNDSHGLNYFSSTKVPVKNEKGETLGIIGIVRDISEQMETENEISRYIEELQVNKDESEEAAGQLAYLNVKLTESEEKLKELNANKDKFFSIISHDLKSPFTCLMGFSDFLLNDIDEMEKEEIKEFVQSINNSAKGVFKLLQNLLDWSRIQTNRIEFLPGLINLEELIENIKDIYQANLIQKNISLVLDVEKDLKAFADKNMIDTVIRNLLSNAIKFTPYGNRIFLSAKKNDEQIFVSVKDEGVGISEKNLDKLFRIDEHLTTEGTNAEKGTGLGLILCREFINKNGGEIGVKSETEKGSEFYFNLQTKNIFNN